MLTIQNNEDLNEYSQLFLNGILISDRLHFEDEANAFSCEGFSENSNFDLSELLASDLTDIQYNVVVLFWEFHHYHDLFRLINVQKKENTFSVEYFSSFYELEKTDWKVKDIFKVAEKLGTEHTSIKVEVHLNDHHIEDNSVSIEISFPLKSKPIEQYINESKMILSEFWTQIQNTLGNWNWKSEYDTNEAIFTREIVIPMLRKKGLKAIKYNHGANEFGKDVICSYLNIFGRREYIAVQVKIGDVKGSVNGKVNELIEQINDAFQIPINNLTEVQDVHISKMIVAISGKFTDNATVKIKARLDNSLLGNIIFLQKDEIIGTLLE